MVRSKATNKKHRAVSVGCEAFCYEVRERWEQLPEGWDFIEVTAVATDSQNRVYVFNRGEHPIIVFDKEGRFVTSWGEKTFVRPHGVTIGPDDSVYCTDDSDHTVRKYTPDGQLLLKLGTSGKPADTGAVTVDYRTIKREGPPFNFPTNLAIASNGDLYVADGYGNARIHHFSPDGKLLKSWGKPGTAPGEFRIPHGIAIDREGTLYVADRENSRVQLFSPKGKFLTEWTDVLRPCEVFIDAAGIIYVAELGHRSGLWSGMPAPGPDAIGGRVSIFNSDGVLLARWGGGKDPCAPGDFFAPHDVWVDSTGDIYVSEVVMSAGGRRGMVPSTCHSLQKFVREE